VSTLGITLVHPAAVESMWPIVADWITSAINRDFDSISLEYVRDTVRSGQNELWVLDDDAGEPFGAAVTIVEHLPNGKKVLGIMVAGGESAIAHLDKWKALMDVLDAYGYSEGAHELRIVGRAAFKRLFADCGFEHRYTVLGRKIARRN